MMRELTIDQNGVMLYARIDGVDDRFAPTLVFSNSLGTTLQLWQKIIPLLPEGLRLIRYDLRGHGQSDIPVGLILLSALVKMTKFGSQEALSKC